MHIEQQWQNSQLIFELDSIIKRTSINILSVGVQVYFDPLDLHMDRKLQFKMDQFTSVPPSSVPKSNKDLYTVSRQYPFVYAVTFVVLSSHYSMQS